MKGIVWIAAALAYLTILLLIDLFFPKAWHPIFFSILLSVCIASLAMGHKPWRDRILTALKNELQHYHSVWQNYRLQKSGIGRPKPWRELKAGTKFKMVASGALLIAMWALLIFTYG